VRGDLIREPLVSANISAPKGDPGVERRSTDPGKTSSGPEHVSSTDVLSLSRLEGLTRAMMARGADMWLARRQALTILDRQVTAQASVIAYSRIYMLSAILILSLIPLLVLVRQTKGEGGGHAVME